MADAEESPMIIDADALVTDDAPQVKTESPDTTAVPEEGDKPESEDVSKVFTAVEGDGSEVQYVTMTQEEAEAAGVEDDDQVVTTSLQFDPANPSVLYTADGTLINQADLSPEEQALVQAALQQHLAEQEAEQQLALIDQSSGKAAVETTDQEAEAQVTDATAMSTAADEGANTIDVVSTAADAQLTAVTETASTDPVAVISSTSDEAVAVTSSVDFNSPSTAASQMVQNIADNVRREQEYQKAQSLLERAASLNTKTDLPEGFRYEEKIVIRQGQPQVVKIPVRAPPTPKKPEIPAVLANLMPKVEIGKDGSQVIRIHQSQITADQLKSLQENPNVRLVFRPASTNRRGASNAAAPYNITRKRGRPRKNYISAYSPALNPRHADASPKASRYGRPSKMPYYQKDYLSADLENGGMDTDEGKTAYVRPQIYPIVPGRRGRPPGSGNRLSMEKGYRRAPSYARKMEQMRQQEFQHDEELNNARLSIVPQKPVLSSVELAISTRRKNRLRELLGSCSDEEIMEVALPHLARVFSLWEFLIMKVEKNKMSRVYFADVYKEYEVLHRYVSRLAQEYKKTLEENKNKNQADSDEVEQKTEENLQAEKKKFVKIRCKGLAESLGIEDDELEDAFITLLDAEPISSTSKQASGENKEAAANDLKEEKSDFSGSALTNEATLIKMPSLIPVSAGQSQKEAGSTEIAESNAAQQSAIESAEKSDEATSGDVAMVTDTAEGTEGTTSGTQIIQIGTGDDKQYIEVPEGYTLIQTPEGLVMSQPGTTLSQAEDGTIYVTHEDGTTTALDSQKAVPVDSLLSMEGQQEQGETEQPLSG